MESKTIQKSFSKMHKSTEIIKHGQIWCNYTFEDNNTQK